MVELNYALAPARRQRRGRAITIPLLTGILVVATSWALFDASAATAAPVVERNAAHAIPAKQLATPGPHIVQVQAPTWSIAIATVGMQAEIDACQWVRMDFSAAVPLPVVAAHNFCGGAIVLDMKQGDTVSLSGTGLDGLYVVVEGRDASADQDAVDAIAGLPGSVILQTCYWSNDGAERLVALTRVG